MAGPLVKPRTDEYTWATTTGFTAQTLGLLRKYKLPSIVDHVFPFDHIRQAHEPMENNRNLGKIVLKVN